MSNVEVSTELLGNAVSYVEKASAVFDAQEKTAAEIEAQAKVTLETLKKQGLCPPGVSDEQLLEKLCNPVESLKALEKTAAQVEAPRLGEPAEVKVASEQRGGVRVSDEAFETALGL